HKPDRIRSAHTGVRQMGASVRDPWRTTPTGTHLARGGRLPAWAGMTSIDGNGRIFVCCT
ncbi:hypothetical protein, partial [Acinetobacter nosocomialis]|uniref:hypothetical protein n=1 Tax=Acinetobacter nosocomialis TaxID=106654 RepID=UPI00148F306B